MNSLKWPYIYVLVRTWNNYDYLTMCLNSILRQRYQNFQILMIDDASDYTQSQRGAIKSLVGKNNVAVFNQERKYSLHNAYYMLHQYAVKREAVVFNLDGDDYLLGNGVFGYIAKVYQQFKPQFTYGECLVKDPALAFWKRWLPARYVISGMDRRYPKEVEEMNGYRDESVFRPLHPRTWRVDAFLKIRKDDFLDNKSQFFKTCEDQAIFMPLLEMAGGNYRVLTKPLCVYRKHELSDNQVHLEQQLKDKAIIRAKGSYKPLAS